MTTPATSDPATMRRALDAGAGVLRLAPTWVPRVFCIPGRRLKLHPDDLYAFGTDRGGIDERWLASTTPAQNGPRTSPDEGLSFAVFADGERLERFTLRDAIAELGAALIGERLWEAHRGWPMYAKFFDNLGALPFHIHQRDEHARLVGQVSKPEAYYYPAQMNPYGADFPFTFFGLEPGVTREQVRESLVNFTKGENRITNLSKAYRLQTGTGWDVPAGILHAPGSLCTYEPQRASDVMAMFQSIVNHQVIPEELLWANTPPERVGDFDYLLEVIDWEANVDPEFARRHFMLPRPARPEEAMAAEGYHESWISYRSSYYGAKELTVQPGRTVTLRDAGAYGLVMLQGHGTLGNWEIEAPALIRFGQPTQDEFFVSEEAARAGVAVTNRSAADPLVMLKHFGPGNPEMPEPLP